MASVANTRRSVALAGVAAVCAGLTVAAGTASPAVRWSGGSATMHVQQVTALGGAHLSGRAQIAARYADTAAGPAGPTALTSELRIPRTAKSRPGKAPAGAATVSTIDTVTDTTPAGFPGLTHRDQRLADNGNQFSLEPPDQGLCVHNGQVLEPVNLALAVYSTSGRLLAGPTALNPFFTGDHAILRSDPSLPEGKFLSDPRCTFDPDTGRWFVTILETDVYPIGSGGTPSAVLVAVSNTDDATGGWKIFAFNTTDDGSKGTPKHPDCPCFGDQPLIGTDAYGLYITTNEYGDDTGFNGAQVYALDKYALAAHASSRVVAINAGAIPAPDAGAIWYTLQPATAPPGGAQFANGTELFASALQFGPSNFDNRIALWRMTGTGTLSSRHPAVSLTVDVLSSEVYGNPIPMTQKNNNALRPLGTSVKEPVETVDSNDDRMQQAVYAAGRLWTGLNTMVLNGNGGVNTAVAWFSIDPAGKTVATQGYVAIGQNGNVAFPSIAVNNQGNGVIGFSAMGPNMFPSTAYVRVTATGTAGPVHINAVGAAPEDGYSGYAAFGGAGDARWGDYSAAVVDADGSIWMGQEYIPDAPRTVNANWGTFVGHVTP